MTSSMDGSRATRSSLMPVRCAMNGGMGSPGFTSAWKTPVRSPPRYLTAPTSVMRQSRGEPPVVSRSTTQKVTSCSGMPSSSVVWMGSASTAASIGSERAGASGYRTGVRPAGMGEGPSLPMVTVGSDTRRYARG